jgi:8-oxo-dGTP diphosphatase
MAEDQFWVGVHGVIAESGRLLVLKRAPEMRYCPGIWDLPGGHLAAHEALEECLVREVLEETGLSVEIERLLGVHKTSGPYVQALFACRRAGGNGREVRLREHEHVDSRWVTPAELSNLDLIPYLEGVLRRGLLGYLIEQSAG